MLKVLTTSTFLAMFATSASAGICDYRPTESLGQIGADVTKVTSIAIATASEYLKLSDYYVIRHASDGIDRLGSTKPGQSAARTVGIIKNSKWGARAYKLLTRPKVTLISLTVVGTAEVYEASCDWINRPN